MKPRNTAYDSLWSCLDEIPKFQANLRMLNQEYDSRQRRLDELMRVFPRIDDPDHERRRTEMKEHRDRLEELEALRDRVEPELEDLLRNCRESEARRPDEPAAAPTEDSLRKTIEDPRYWSDGDPGLVRFVSEGFKRLYPGDEP